MKVIELNGKAYTSAQLRAAIEKQVRGKDPRSLAELMDELPAHPPEPEYKRVVLSIRDDPIARMHAERRLERGISGFGDLDPLLRVAECLLEVYVRFVRKKSR